jgi:hypothetical protein
MLAPWAFKGAPIVIWLIIRFDRNEPHLSIANFATRTAHYPRVWNDLIFSHDALTTGYRRDRDRSLSHRQCPWLMMQSACAYLKRIATTKGCAVQTGDCPIAHCDGGVHASLVARRWTGTAHVEFHAEPAVTCPLLMLWTAPPPARECRGYGCG